MTKIEVTVKEEADGIQLVGNIHETEDATRTEKAIAHLLASAIKRFEAGLEAHMEAEEAAR